MCPERITGGFGSAISQGMGFFSSSFTVFSPHRQYAPVFRAYSHRCAPDPEGKVFPSLLHSSPVRGNIIGSLLHIIPEVIFLSYQYGNLLRILHWCAHQSMTAALEQMGLTAAQGHIMAYLNHQSQPPCPKDIEEEFQLSHPTVSGLLQRLEQKEFIALRADETDRRKKRIYILPRGHECHNLMHRVIEENERRIVENFTPEEQRQFADLLQRSITNMGGNPCRRNHKEDDTQ